MRVVGIDKTRRKFTSTVALVTAEYNGRANVNANGTLATQRSAQASSEPGPATIAARPGSRSIPEPRTELT